MMVSTRVVTDGSAGLGECAEIFCRSTRFSRAGARPQPQSLQNRAAVRVVALVKGVELRDSFQDLQLAGLAEGNNTSSHDQYTAGK